MPAFLYLIVKRPWLVILATFLLLILSVSTIYNFSTKELRISVEPSIDQLLPKSDKSKQYYDRVKQQFGNDEILIIALESEDMFTYNRLNLVKTLTNKIERIEHVERVVSLANLTNTYNSERDIISSLALEVIPQEADKLEKLRYRILDNTLFNGNVVSNDSHMMSLLVSFGSISDADMITTNVIDEIITLVDKEAQDVSVYYTGNPFIKTETTRIILHDLIWLPIIVIAVIAIVLIFSFRTLHGVLVPLATAFVSVVFTIAIITALGYALNIVTAMVPALLMTLGLAYTVHAVSDFHKQCSDFANNGDIQLMVSGSLKTIMLPVLLAGFTTSAGFLSLVFSNMYAIQQFGVFSVIGVLIIVALSITFTPALLVVMGKIKRLEPDKENRPPNSMLDDIITKFAEFDYKHSKPIFIASFVLFSLAVFHVPDIRIGTEYVGNFKDNSQVSISFNRVNESLSGANIFSIVMKSEQNGAFSNVENLRVVEDLQHWLAKKIEIGSTLSIVDYIKFMNHRMHNDQDEYNLIPKSEVEISSILKLGNDHYLDSMIDKKFKTVRIIVRAKVIDSDKLSSIIDQIEDRLQIIPKHLNPVVTGNSVLLNKTIEMITEGQIISIGISLIIVYLILSGLFMSLRIGLIALIPNLLPITVYYSALAIFDITLNPATSLIGPMVLGIAVDDTIHYFSHFSRDAKRLANDRKATISSLKAIGKPITYTSLGLCLGFLMFLFSDLKMQNQVGLMAAFTLAIAWLTDFILTPALCSKLRLATLWDVLTLDLGESPNKSIPLLSELKPSQAKIVALMSSVKELPAGENLFVVGDKGNEMYIVIDGKLQSFIETKKGRAVLSEHIRGDVVGEIGLYNKTRSANIDVVDNVRLLRISPNSMARLKKRYPRIAAQVLCNLNKILVKRLVKLTDRIH